MKQKIKEALKQKYNNLGLGDDVFEGVASSIETLISDEAQIPTFVANAESMLKKYQSIGDKDRTTAAAAQKRADDLQKLLDEANAKLKDKGGDGGNGGGDDKNLADTIAAAVAAAIKPISDELATIKNANSSKDATNAAKAAFFGNDYAKKYTDEAADAWERAIEVFEATGSTLTAEELTAKAQGYFSKAVSRKGVDTSKPFVADNIVDSEGTTDWSAERQRKQEQGKIAADKQ